MAIKALGRKPEDDLEDLLSDEEDKAGGEGGAKGPAPMNRGNIVQGFNNLKKELSILSPLRHPNIVQLFGVSVEPLGLVLELAPKGDLKAILKEYKEAQNHLQPAAIQAVVRQVCVCVSVLYVCLYACMSVCIYVCLSVCISVYQCVCTCISVCLYVRLSVCVSVHVYQCVCICISVCLYMYVCAYVYVCL